MARNLQTASGYLAYFLSFHVYKLDPAVKVYGPGDQFGPFPLDSNVFYVDATVSLKDAQISSGERVEFKRFDDPTYGPLMAVKVPSSAKAGDSITLLVNGREDTAIAAANTVQVQQYTAPAKPFNPYATSQPTPKPRAATTFTGSDRRLVVFENNITNPDYGRLIQIPPGQAAGIGLPAFEVGANRPQTGNVIGEGFFEESTGTALIWNGTVWDEVIPRAEVRPWNMTGAYTVDTIVIHNGMLWRSKRGVLAGVEPTSPSNDWEPLGMPGIRDIPAICDPVAGLDSIPKIAGAMAVDQSTRRHYYYSGSEWIELTGMVYSATPVNTLPRAVDVLMDDTATPTWAPLANLQLFVKKVYDQLAVVRGSAPIIGEIKMFARFQPLNPGWQVCDGAPIAPSNTAAIAILGANVPDLRDRFIRGWNPTEDPGTFADATTGEPSSGLTVNGSGAHNHAIETSGGLWSQTLVKGETPGGLAAAATNKGLNSTDVQSDGFHGHVLAGWDAETAPQNMRVVYAVFIGT